MADKKQSKLTDRFLVRTKGEFSVNEHKQNISVIVNVNLFILEVESKYVCFCFSCAIADYSCSDGHNSKCSVIEFVINRSIVHGHTCFYKHIEHNSDGHFEFDCVCSATEGAECDTSPVGYIADWSWKSNQSSG